MTVGWFTDICPSCGQKNSGFAEECKRCGTRLGPQPPAVKFVRPTIDARDGLPPRLGFGYGPGGPSSRAVRVLTECASGLLFFAGLATVSIAGAVHSVNALIVGLVCLALGAVAFCWAIGLIAWWTSWLNAWRGKLDDEGEDAIHPPTDRGV